MQHRFSVLAGLFFLPAVALAGAPEPVLEATLQSLAKEGAARGALVGVVVVDLDTGETLFESQPDTPFNPASVTKVVTTAAALKTLGSGYTFKTHVSRAGRLTNGVLAGDLVLAGEGDPSLTLERVWRIASRVRVAGVKEITGDLVLDDTYFDSERTMGGYDSFDEDKAYTAPVGALSATWNTVNVVIRPGARAGAQIDVALDPPTAFVTLVNKGTTSSAGQRRRMRVSIENRVITVAGTMPVGHPEREYYRPVDDPTAYFGTLLREYLAKEGVVVKGSIRKGSVPDAIELFAYESEPLGVIVRDLNKLSNNFTAEQLLKTLGAKTWGAPGTAQKGLDALSKYLLELGVPEGSWSIRNGSGLTRDNEISARLLVRVLEDAHADFQVRGDFVASMGIAGEDGTLAHRMVGTQAAGALRGKTGTVAGSTCLAGYARAENGHTLAFAFLMNRVEGQTKRAMNIQDRMGAALAGWKGKPSTETSLLKPETPTP